jgi:hypothetical protein
VPPPPGQEPPPFLDPSGDGRITLNDVLVVVFAVLTQQALAAGEAEAESTVASTAADAAPIVIVNPPSSSVAPAKKSKDPEFAVAAGEGEFDADSPTEYVASDTAVAGPAPARAKTQDLEDSLDSIAGDVASAWEHAGG